MSLGRDRGPVTPDLDTDITITTADLSPTEADVWLGKHLTCYAKDGLSMAQRQLRRAYGDRYPGSYQRWADKAGEREASEWMDRARAAWKLYRRVHGEPCAA